MTEEWESLKEAKPISELLKEQMSEKERKEIEEVLKDQELCEIEEEKIITWRKSTVEGLKKGLGIKERTAVVLTKMTENIIEEALMKCDKKKS